MGVYAQGADAVLSCWFYRSVGGLPADPSAVLLEIVNHAGTEWASASWPGMIQRLAEGSFQYTWPVPADLSIGAYEARWTGAMPGGDQTGIEQLLIVTGGLVMAGTPPFGCWATAADVANLTGVVVTDRLVQTANAMVEIMCSRTYADAGAKVSSRDAEWLRRAVAYQAAWLPSQPDAFQRMDLTNFSGTSPAPTGLVLAPLARWALGRVSWLKSRSLHVKSPFTDATGGALLDPITDSSDTAMTFVGFAGGTGSFGND